MMDRRSWPWKKKSSEKAVTTTDSITVSLSSSGSNQADQDNTKSVSYVQISSESYAHLTELEDQVKVLNEKLNSAHEKLSSSQSEITAKDILVKQHAKVAEEAVSGWEKAEAEAMALKHQLESVTLLKLTAEERACHLDSALKECMKQIRNVKEESEQKLQDVVFARTKQWEKVKLELEDKINDFEQELLRASAENAALSRSLQERSNVLMKMSDEKLQADAEIEVLKNNIQSREREISSLKYELHIVSKELEIRNEEKNMAIRSADVANKQHVEDAKKITKLEAECQRLRGLVRKKLPGPAALAQMKVEVENLGRDYGETRLRRSPARGASTHHLPVPDFALENIQHSHNENEFLTVRLLAMEEETKMLKEALSKRNSELQASRNMCAKTVNKLHSLEAQMLAFNRQLSPSKPNLDIHFENGSNPPSLTSMSEDGVDEVGSCSESWATALISELSHFKKEKDVDKGNKADHSELMDDFLEMERLACLPTEADRTITIADGVGDKMKIGHNDVVSLVVDPKDGGCEDQQKDLERLKDHASTTEEQPAHKLTSNRTDIPLLKLKSRIASIFESQSQDNTIAKILEHIRCVLQDTEEELPQHSVSCIFEETCSIATSEQNHCDEAMGEIINRSISLKHDSSSCTHIKLVIDQESKNAVSQIYDFAISLGKEAMKLQGRSSDDHGLSLKIEKFSKSVNKVFCSELGLNDFILALSHILSEATELASNMLSDKHKEGDSNSYECIDKVTLLENKVDQHEPSNGRFSGASMLASRSSSDTDIEKAIGVGFELKSTLQKCSLEEFEKLKTEKENVQINLARCSEMLEQTNLRLIETEQQLAVLKSQLAASEKSNSLAETQLKCMAQSYKSLESRTQELETEINLLHTKAETLDNELQEERLSHQDDLAKYKELQEQIERNAKSSLCSFPSDADFEIKTKQENEIAAAAEKLAECQETILLLGRQLKALHPPAEPMDSSPNNRYRISDSTLGEEPSPTGFDVQGMNSSQHSDQVEVENTANSITQTAGGESPLNGYDSHLSPSDTEAGHRCPQSPISSKRQKHRSSGSSSSSCSSSALPEKHGRGFSRFFSKGKSYH